MTSKLNLTLEDRKILQHVEEFGFITINETQNMFYNTQGHGYEIARRHLSKIVVSGKLSVFKETYCNKNVYYMKDKPSYHSILLMDYYSLLVRSGAFIRSFERKQPWMNKKYNSDAFCMYTLGDNVFFDIIEVVRAKGVDVNKYKDIYESKDAHDICDGLYNLLEENNESERPNEFPRLVVIDDVEHNSRLSIPDDITIVQLDYNLSEFSRLFV